MIIPLGFAQLTFAFTGVACPTGAVITLGVNPEPSGNPAVIAEGAGTAFGDTVLPLLTNTVTLSSVTCKLGPNDLGASVEWPFSLNGGDASGCSGPAVAYLVRKFTASGGRKERGLWYLPGVAESAISSGGTVDLTKVLAINDALVDFQAALVTLEAPPVLLHSDPGDGPTAIVAMLCQDMVATQRRRQRR